MSSPDLFVVCKNCQAEVSPYVTECPYCGTRLRKRAPKIEREGDRPKPPEPPKRGRFSRRTTAKATKAAKPAQTRPERPPRLSKLRSGEIPGVRGDEFGRPYATFALIFLIMGVWLSAAVTVADDLALVAIDGDPWRYVTATAYNGNFAAQLAVVVGVGLFGWLLERRHGGLLVIAVFVLCGPGSLAAAIELDADTLAFGSHGAALGLLAAWFVPVGLARRRRADDDDADLYGVVVIAVVLLLVPVVAVGSAIAGVIGGAAGALVGLVLARARPR